MMNISRCLPYFCLVLGLSGSAVAADDPVFRSEVSLSRVDARVLDRDGHAVTGLTLHDFVLRLGDKEVPIRNFTNENAPIDILLLLDVSGSMEPHVERIASAAEQALRVLGDQDRVGIMVFDTRTRVRLPFRNSQGEVTRELNRLISRESFNGGTRITGAMMDAARYLEREARPEARRAIVILTDDMTQDGAQEGRVETALRNAKAVMSFLRAPYEEPSGFGGGPMPGRRRGPWGSNGGGGGGSWPGGGGGGWPGSGGGGPIGFPGRGGSGGGIPMSSPSHSAGTETIAMESGGDTMDVSDAAALEDTLARLRQRYALYYYLPEGVSEAQRAALKVSLAETASIRYHGAEIQSRRVFMAGGAENNRLSEPATVTRVSDDTDTRRSETSSGSSNTSSDAVSNSNGSSRRSRAVNEDSGTKVNSVGQDSSTSSPDSSKTDSTTQPSTSAHKSGWPRATDKPTPPNQFVPTR